MTYLTYHLSRHPAIQAGLRAELPSKTNPIPLRFLDELPLLEACVLETHRLTPSISGPLPRVTPSGGCRLGDFYVPGGVKVSGQAYSLHKEAKWFRADVYEWRPDRWLDAGEEKLKEMKRWMWPFGGGGRGCVGQWFPTLRRFISVVKAFSNFPGVDSKNVLVDYICRINC